MEKGEHAGPWLYPHKRSPSLVIQKRPGGRVRDAARSSQKFQKKLTKKNVTWEKRGTFQVPLCFVSCFYCNAFKQVRTGALKLYSIRFSLLFYEFDIFTARFRHDPRSTIKLVVWNFRSFEKISNVGLVFNDRVTIKKRDEFNVFFYWNFENFQMPQCARNNRLSSSLIEIFEFFERNFTSNERRPIERDS